MPDKIAAPDPYTAPMREPWQRDLVLGMLADTRRPLADWARSVAHTYSCSGSLEVTGVVWALLAEIDALNASAPLVRQEAVAAGRRQAADAIRQVHDTWTQLGKLPQPYLDGVADAARIAEGVPAEPVEEATRTEWASEHIHRTYAEPLLFAVGANRDLAETRIRWHSEHGRPSRLMSRTITVGPWLPVPGTKEVADR